MKTNFLMITLILSMMFISGTSKINAQPLSDEAQLREVVSKMKEGWNTKSGETFASVFAEKHDYIIWTGMFIPELSKIQNAQQHQAIFDSVYKNTQMENEVSKIKMICDDLALVHVYGKVWEKDKPAPKDWGVLISLLIEKQDEAWKIISFHNCDIEKGVGPTAGQFYATQELAIKEKVNTLNDAWNGRDAEAMAAHFVDGYDHVVANQQWMTDFSREACRKGHQHLFEKVYTQPGTGKIKDLKIQFLKADVALVHVSLTEDNNRPEQEDLLTLIFEMDQYENWLIRAFNLTPVAPKPAKQDR